ncbi:MAG: DUF3311 domain-containing protein [Acetobacteraceae bacterium]
MSEPHAGGGRTWSWARLVLLVPFVLALDVPLYNRMNPAFLGFPFFYWFQLLLVLVGAVAIALVLLVEG